jgi:hypothetical protein
VSAPTFYEILGVAPTASGEELRRAYLAQARRHHPDTGGDGPAMTRLNEAWSVLSDPVKRRGYDLELGLRVVGQPIVVDTGGAAARVPFDADPGDLFDDRPFGPEPARGSLVLLPPGLFAASVLLGCLAMVFDSPPMLGAAVVLFVVSCMSIAAVAMWMLRSTARR